MSEHFAFQNVNINSINFVNNKNDVKFEFFDSFVNSGKYCGELICVDVLSLNMETDLDDDPFFPQYICDVSSELVSENENKYITKLQGGSYDITIVSRSVEIVDNAQ